jgi:hypothetical protein
MSFAVSREEMEAAFGADRLVRVPADRLNPAVTHAPSAEFLTGWGLPDVPHALFGVDDGLSDGCTGALDFEPGLGDATDLPAGSWVLVGWCWDDAVLLDGATGQVRVLDDADFTVRPVNSRIDLFVRCVAALERDYPDHLDPKHPREHRKAAVDNLLVEMRGIDPEAFTGPEAYWYKAVDTVALEY